MKSNILKILAAVSGIAVLLAFFTKLFTPVWYSWNQDNTVKGIYKEPDNRIQVLFLGSSKVVNAISPITLYNEYGICSYNMGTEKQRYLSSYYWLREIYKHHSESLKIVVLDVSPLFEECDEAFDEKALTHMKFSSNKIEAFRAMEELYDNYSSVDHLVPIIAYHSRWADITGDDFQKFIKNNNHYYTRGQHLDFTTVLYADTLSRIFIPNNDFSEIHDYTAEELESVWDENNREYLYKIAEFCRNKGLSLVFTGLVRPAADDLMNESINYLSRKLEVPYINTNLPEIQKEIGLDFAYDFVDRGSHVNVFGAEKVSRYIGAFLKTNYEIEDIRGQQSYAYLDEMSGEFEKINAIIALRNCEDLDAYLDLLNSGNYSIFLSVMGESIDNLSLDQRKALDGLGFHRISEAVSGSSYVGLTDQKKAVIDEIGKIFREGVAAIGMRDDNSWTSSGILNPYVRNDNYSVRGGFFLTSIGAEPDSYSSIWIFENNYSIGKRGLNFAVYDNDFNTVVDRSCFDTHLPDAPKMPYGLYDKYLSQLNQVGKE